MSGFSFAELQKVAKESGFVVLDADTYEMEVSKADAVKSKNTNKDMIKVTLKVVVGPLAGKGTVPHNFVISPENGKALFFFFKHMAAFGLDEAYFAQNPQPAEVAKHLVGRRALVTVSVGEWQGNAKNDVDDVKPVTGSPAGVPPISNGVASGIPNIPSPATTTTTTTTTSNGSNGAAVDVPTMTPEPAMAGATANNGAAAEAGVPAMPKAPF